MCWPTQGYKLTTVAEMAQAEGSIHESRTTLSSQGPAALRPPKATSQGSLRHSPPDRSDTWPLACPHVCFCLAAELRPVLPHIPLWRARLASGEQCPSGHMAPGPRTGTEACWAHTGLNAQRTLRVYEV